MIEPAPTELARTIERYGLEIPADRLPALDLYCQSLWAFNRRLNLTRHNDYDKFVSRDLVDTIQLSQLIPPNQAVLDVGSGGGVPGMTLAILRPDLDVTLCESVSKKTAALDQIADCLQLKLEIYNARAETLLEDFRYDVTVARAVGPLRKIATWFQDCWPHLGRLLAVKGPNWPAEQAEAEAAGLLQGVTVRVAAEYATPGADWDSVILEVMPRVEQD